MQKLRIAIIIIWVLILAMLTLCGCNEEIKPKPIISKGIECSCGSEIGFADTVYCKCGKIYIRQ